MTLGEVTRAEPRISVFVEIAWDHREKLIAETAPHHSDIAVGFRVALR